MKKTLTTLIAAATMGVAGFALAQANPPTSTAGAGCTATANAMKGGNLGGSPSNTACGDKAPTAAAPATTTTTSQAPAPMTSSTTTSGATADTSSSTTAAAPTARARPMRVARADRN